MRKSFFALLALGMIAAPLSAQIVVRSGGDVSVRHDRIPPGQLPPRGLCRVWIDGVPPGQQPGVTDCVTAERNRVANSRVIYGDVQSFPGKGKGKFKTTSSGDVSRRCTMWDAVVVNARVVDVCRDDTVIRRRDDDDEERLEKLQKEEAKRLEKQRKEEAKALSRQNKEAAKAAKKAQKHGYPDRDR